MTLSHVKAYLQLGNIVKADERFQTIQTPELVPEAMLTLAHLRAAKGDSLGAQQAFMFAIDNHPQPNLLVSPDLLNYFCQQKDWQALESYGTSLLNSSNDITVNNSSLGSIGQCFFNSQEWDKAKYWLNQLDLELVVSPLDFLALARLSIEDKQYAKAEQFINRFEETKNNVNARTLWTALEVYQGLQQPERVEQIGQNLSALFPDSDSSLVYRQMAKLKIQGVRKTVKTATQQQAKRAAAQFIHVIKKGETLYQLSKRYAVTTSELMSWNPNLVIDDISIGTKIRIIPIP